MSDSESAFKLAAYGVAAGCVIIGRAYNQIKRKIKMKILAKNLICSASGGTVEAEAVAWPFRAVDTSLKGNKIVFRYIELKKRVSRGKSSSWETVWEKATPEPFLIFDHSGFMIVNVGNTNSFLAMTDGLITDEYNPYKLTSAQLESFEEFYDNSVSGFRASIGGTKGFFDSLTSATYKIYERSIPVGCPLLVHGYFKPEDTFRYVEISGDFKLFQERASKLVSNKNFRLSIFDKNKDGKLDEQELKRGFIAAVKNSVKSDFKITNVTPTGIPKEKIYGTITSSSDSELMLSEGFEEQILHSNPVFMNWLFLYAGAGIIACSIIYFMTLLN